MKKTLPLTIKQGKAFDCSDYLGDKLNWPVDASEDLVDELPVEINRKNEHYDQNGKQEIIKYIPIGNKANDQRNQTITAERDAKGKLNEHFYESEYNFLLQWIGEEKIIASPSLPLADKRQTIKNISLLADKSLSRESHIKNVKCYNYQSWISTCEDLAKQVALKAIESPRQGATTGKYRRFVKEQVEGFGNSTEKGQSRKSRLCRHFLKGYCLRGESCDFLHDLSIFWQDEQKVFLGGLPLDMTPASLKNCLEDKGMTILNKPRALRGYSPEVCLGSVEEAQKLICVGYINIGDHRVTVRPFQDKDKLRHLPPRPSKRSVFLGGLPEATTGEMIIHDLGRLDVKVDGFPIVNNGFAPRVVLESLKHKKLLVALKRVMINGSVVDVRPYVNFRKKYYR